MSRLSEAKLLFGVNNHKELNDLDAKLDDLRKQAEMFDMDIDYDRFELEPKRPPKKLTYWDWVNENKDYVYGVDEGVLDHD